MHAKLIISTELVLPDNCSLEFKDSKLKNMCGTVELGFSAKLSNVLIVAVVCHATLRPEMVWRIFIVFCAIYEHVLQVWGELKVELECVIQSEGIRTTTSFKIFNLLVCILAFRLGKVDLSLPPNTTTSAFKFTSVVRKNLNAFHLKT